MTITDLFLATPLAIIAYFIWQHSNISYTARNAAKHYCNKEGVQLLDQTVILKGMSIKRSSRSLFSLRRKYGFEFSSVGDHRYKGCVYLYGNRVQDVELEPFKIERVE